MRKSIAALALALTFAPAARADDYAVDPAHTSLTFKIQHVGISWVYGRFNNVSGTFTVDKADPSKSSFELTIKTDSVDTGNAARDKHLKSPDFFNAVQYPTVTFKSTAVKPVEGGVEVTGDLTLHGQTKPVTVVLKGGDKEVEFPKGFRRVGFSGAVKLKRSEFGMDKMVGPVGDEIPVEVSFEGVKK
jgi:polyisoprenoid-binding protein YceI